MSRMAIEFRASQQSYDIVHMTTINKLPPQIAGAVRSAGGEEHPAGGARSRTGAGTASTPTTIRPPTTPSMVKASDLPKTYEEFAQQRNGPGRSPSTAPTTSGSRRMFDHYGEQKATQVIKDIVATLKPIVTDGHLAHGARRPAPANTRSRSTTTSICSTQREARRRRRSSSWRSIRWRCSSGRSAINAKAPHPERRQARRQLHAQPGMPAVPGRSSAACRRAAT